MTRRGTVAVEEIRKGALRGRSRVVLDTEDGERLALRRIGGDPLFDPLLAKLAGERIEGFGEERNGSLTLLSFALLPFRRPA